MSNPAHGTPRIRVTRNGPYDVSGHVPLTMQVITPNREGFSWDWKEGRAFDTGAHVQLCRCGHSKTKPFCDDSHVGVGFDGKETATHARYAQQAEVIDGATLELRDAEQLCAFARFCDPAGKIWGLMERTGDPEARALAIREAAHCPGGRLVVRDKETGQDLEPELPPSIGIVEDPALKCSGPLWVRGGIPIESADGRVYDTRNRVALCRCGASSNKPFCDGSHASVKFKDGLPRA